MRVWLYPCNLEGHKGEFFARTENEKTLTLEQICVAAKERGGFTGSIEDLKEHIAIFLREAVHQMRDGFAVNFGGLFVVYFHVGGFFENGRAQADKEQNPVTVHFRPLSDLRKSAGTIEVVCLGVADTQGYIAEIADVTSKTVNEVVTKGGIFILSGDKIEVFGPSNRVGVCFVAPGSPDIAVPVTANLAVNEPSKIIGTVPELLPDRDWYIEVRTNFSGNTGHPLKETRLIRSSFTVRQA
jgi:hypothetical protein